ncbi:hypothetical protein [Photorhabdus temperata]|nr:hypothetical protein [Photorhabdus temperata]
MSSPDALRGLERFAGGAGAQPELSALPRRVRPRTLSGSAPVP